MFQKCVTSAKWMSYVFPLDIPKLATDILLMLTKKKNKNNGFWNCACQLKPQNQQKFELHSTSAFAIHTNTSG